MKNKIKKIVTTSLLSAVAVTTVGCGSGVTKLAKNIDKSMADFVSSINKLDYVDTGTTEHTNNNLGKIVETSKAENTSTREIKTIGNHVHFLNNNISEAEIENTIITPEQQNNKFQLFVLSESPYVTLTSSDNNADLTLNVKFSTEKISNTSSEIETKINKLILKRSILMIYVNEIYNGNVTLSNENKLAIGAYVNVIKENTSFLNGNRGMVKNQLNIANELINSEENENLINYYIIKSGEALETRANKIDSTISAIDSIIEIIENNLNTNSTYYNSNLSANYSNLFSTTTSNETQITESSTNADIAQIVANTLGIKTNQATTQIQNQEQKNMSRSSLKSQTDTNNQINSNLQIQNRTKEQNDIINNSQNNISENTTKNNNQQNISRINNNVRTSKPTGNVQTRRPRRYIKKHDKNQFNEINDSQENLNENQNIQRTDNKNFNNNSAKSVANFDNINNNKTMRADRTNRNMVLDDFRENNYEINNAKNMPFK